MVDLQVQSSDFAATEFEVRVVSDKARAICGAAISFGIPKSGLPEWAEYMLTTYGLVVG
jgi:hypothetical protein